MKRCERDANVFNQTEFNKRIKIETKDRQLGGRRHDITSTVEALDPISQLTLLHLVTPSFTQVFGGVSKICALTPNKTYCIFAIICAREDLKRKLTSNLTTPISISHSDTYAYYTKTVQEFEENVQFVPTLRDYKLGEGVMCLAVCDIDGMMDYDDTLLHLKNTLEREFNGYSHRIDAEVIPLCCILCDDSTDLNLDENEDTQRISDPITKLLQLLKCKDQGDDYATMYTPVKVTSGFSTLEQQTTLYFRVFLHDDVRYLLQSLSERIVHEDYGQMLEYCCLFLLGDESLIGLYEKTHMHDSENEYDTCTYDDLIGYYASESVSEALLNLKFTKMCSNRIYFGSQHSQCDAIFRCGGYLIVDVLDVGIHYMLISRKQEHTNISLVDAKSFDRYSTRDNLLRALSLKWRRRRFYKSDRSFSDYNYEIMYES